MTNAPLSDADVAVRAASAGAAVARSYFGGRLERISDGGVDFTTEADVAAERAIRTVISDLRPTDGIVGEELGDEGGLDRRWLVDPICGTLNFAARVPLFSTNVALQVDDVSAAAAVADPMAVVPSSADRSLRARRRAWCRSTWRASIRSRSARDC